MKKLFTFLLASFVACLTASAATETIFSYTVTSATVAQTALTPDTGNGSIEVNGGPVSGNDVYAVKFDHDTKKYAKIILGEDETFLAGDVITVNGYTGSTPNGSNYGFKIGATNCYFAATLGKNKVGPVEYIVTEGDGICGKNTFTIYRISDNSSYFHNVTITREVEDAPVIPSYTIYYGNSGTNYENVYAHIWTTEDGTDTPLYGWGVAESKMTLDDEENNVWKYEFQWDKTPMKVIFHNNSGTQTDEQVFVDGKTYGASIYRTSVKFDATASQWSTVYAHIWNGSNNNGWPGTEMTKGADGLFSADFTTTWEPTNIIFSNGETDETYTLDFVNGNTYTDNSKYGNWTVEVGYFVDGNWTTTSAHPVNCIATMTIANGISGQFKIHVTKDDNTDYWRGNGSEIALESWTNIGDGNNMTFPAETANRTTTVKFNVHNDDVYLEVVKTASPAPTITIDNNYMVIIAKEEGTPNLYYTTDGSRPTVENGTLYEAPFQSFEGTIVRAAILGTTTTMTDSEIVSARVHVTSTTYSPNIWYAPADSPVAAETTLMNDENVTVTTVYQARTVGYYYTFDDFEFKNILQVRVKADPSSSAENGTNQDGSTPLAISVHKDVAMTFYYRRQANSNSYVDNDGKDLKIFSKIDFKAVPGSLNVIHEFESNGGYAQVYKTVVLPAGEYVAAARGTTLNLYGFNYHAESSETKKIGWDNTETGWETPTILYSIDNGHNFTAKAMTSTKKNEVKALTEGNSKLANAWIATIPANATHITFSDGGNNKLDRMYIGNDIINNVVYDGTDDLTTGVVTVDAEKNEAAPIYYNLQGQRVATPERGIYIKVTGDKVEKVIL